MSLEDKRARKAAREEARKAELDKLEEEALDLEEAWEAKGKKTGVDFEVVTTAVGNFLVTKPDMVTAKRFQDKEDQTTEDVFQFVSPCVAFPDQMVARATFQEHGGLTWVLAAKLMKLYQASIKDLGKK